MRWTTIPLVEEAAALLGPGCGLKIEIPESQ
jgi:hypothetical protein